MRSMHILLLPGMSSKNKEWIDAVSEAVSPFFESVQPHYYSHWESKAGLMDVDQELKHLVETVRLLGKDDYVLFAKSAGVLVALKGIFEEKLHPVKCIFVGAAIGWIQTQGFPIDTWFGKLVVPTLFIQNSHDPAISFKELKMLLENYSVKGYTIRELPGNTHAYNDIERLSNEIQYFILNRGN